MDNPIDGTDGKLGHGFTSADEVLALEIGLGRRMRVLSWILSISKS